MSLSTLTRPTVPSNGSGPETGQEPRSVPHGRWRLSRRVRKTILAFHVVASVGLLGEVWVLVVLNLYSTLTADPDLAQSAYRLMPVLVFTGGIPLSMTALVSGLILGWTSRWGLVRYYWVFLKLLLLITIIGVGMLLFQPAAMVAEAAGGPPSASQQWQQVAVVAGQLLMLLTAAGLSVFKPGGRIGGRRAAGATPA